MFETEVLRGASRSLVLLGFAYALGANLPVYGQIAACQPNYHGDLYVDPEIGVDAANAGCPVRPYKTIGYALTQASTTSPVTIVLNPGLYTTASGESFPLVMKRNVSIQGTNALNTTIRGDITSEGACDENYQVLISFVAQQTGDFDSVCIDSVNLSRGCVDIEITGDAPASPTISNCFITDAALTGIDIVGDEAVHRPKIIHCTFALNKTAITNHTSATAAGEAPVSAPGAPGLMNVLSTYSSVVDFYGIRDVDMQGNSTSGGFLETSSAFDSASSAGLGGGSPPNNSNGVIPGQLLVPPFVEEVVHGTLVVASDLRLNPDLINDQTFPTNLIGGAHEPGPGTISWLNGTTGSFQLANGSRIDDFDCEGYGNPRTTPFYVDGGYPDIGADEVGTYVLAGYPGFTTNWGSNMIQWIGFGWTSTADVYYTAKVVPVPSVRYIDSGLAEPGNRALRTDLPSTTPGINGDGYLDAAFLNSYTTSLAGFPDTVTFTVTLTNRTVFNTQALFPDGVVTVHYYLSNLQTFYKFP